MNLVYTTAQEQVFFKNKKRFTIVSKGRRVGLTRGAAQAFIEYSLLDKPLRILWGETIYSNVQRYVDLFFIPILNQIGDIWQWHARLSQLVINGTVIDFRSADSPETWEGFGYHIVFLNEAGIILRNPELYKKTVLPMLMDYPDSRLIAAGVPKGKKLKSGSAHPFYELWELAESQPSYARYKFTTYQNPFLSISDIKEIEGALDDRMRLQEIYGEFIDNTDNPYLYAFESTHIASEDYKPSERLPLYLSFDFNITPNSCLIGQQPDPYSLVVFDEVSVNGSTEEVCNVIMARYSHWVNRGLIFVVGDATGKNRNAMSGELTNYIVIGKVLRLRQYNMKVKTVNNPLDASRVICNAILSRGEVKITKACKQTIIDCQVASVDVGGNLVKESGLHKFDCFRYMLEAVFPDFLNKSYKYQRPTTKPVTQPPLYEKQLIKQNKL